MDKVIVVEMISGSWIEGNHEQYVEGIFVNLEAAERKLEVKFLPDDSGDGWVVKRNAYDAAMHGEMKLYAYEEVVNG